MSLKIGIVRTLLDIGLMRQVTKERFRLDTKLGFAEITIRI